MLLSEPGEPRWGQSGRSGRVRAAVEELSCRSSRVEVMHGVNLDQLGGRDPDHYGDLHAARAGEDRSRASPRSSGWRRPSSRPTTRASSSSACIGSPSARTRRSSTPAPGRTTRGRSRDALEFSGLPAVEVHISDVCQREEWRKRHGLRRARSIGRVYGKGRGRLPRGARADRRAPEEMSAPTAAGVRGARLAELVGRAGPDGSVRQRPDERPLPDRLHRHQRRLPRRPRPARLLHRLPLHRARRAGGGGGLGAAAGRARAAAPDRRADERPRRLRGRQAQRPPARASSPTPSPRGSSWSRPATWSRSCARSRTRARSSGSPPPPSSPTRSTAGRSTGGSPGAPSARSPAPARPGSASWAPSPRSRRSSRRARTARCLTPSPASARSERASWSSSTWAPSSTATARTAPAPSPPATPAPRRARSTSWSARPRRRRWRRSAPASRAATPTPSRAS